MSFKYDFLNEKHMKICSWIDEQLSQRTNYDRNCNSYNLKHICENEVGFYITNYEMVYCMMVCGFKAKKVALFSPNFYFNFNFKRGKKYVQHTND